MHLAVSFAELLLVDINTAQSDAADYVGEATVFVSHAWKCPIVELLDTLIRYTNDRDERTYFWLDVCCSNQHLFDHVSGVALMKNKDAVHLIQKPFLGQVG